MTARGLFSCLCVTEGRPAFIPWLLWGYDRQTWRERELIVVDSSPVPWRPDRPDVRVIAAPPGTNVPTKRNLALAAATGTWVAWFDDDDWQHPQRLALLAHALADDPRAAVAGGTRSFFVDLHGDSCRNYEGYGTIIFNGAGFRREVAQAVRFNEAQRRASDTGWMQALAARGGHRVVAPQILTAWLSHEQNISNDRRRWRFPLPLSALRGEVGAAMWADTDERLAALRSALPPARWLPQALPTPLDRAAQAFGRAHQRGMRLRRLLGNQASHRQASQALARPSAINGTPKRPAAGTVARVDWRARPPADAETGAPFSVVVCCGPEETERAGAALSPLARLMGSAPRTAVALVCTEVRQTEDRQTEDRQTEAGEARPTSDGEPPPWDAIVQIAVARRSEPSAPAITRGALLTAIERADSAEWILLVAGSDAIVDAGPTPWLEPALRRLGADPDLLAVAIPNGGVRGARGAARGAPPGVRGATWDGRLRLWRGRGVTGIAFIAARARLRDVLRAETDVPDLPASLAAVLERALGTAAAAKAFGTLAAKEAWTRRPATRTIAADLGATAERQNV